MPDYKDDETIEIDFLFQPQFKLTNFGVSLINACHDIHVKHSDFPINNQFRKIEIDNKSKFFSIQNMPPQNSRPARNQTKESHIKYQHSNKLSKPAPYMKTKPTSSLKSTSSSKK